MYAIIETGGKQYKVQEGDIVYVEKLNLEEGEAVSFEKVLLMSSETGLTPGKPYVDGAKVEGTVLANGKSKKIVVFKYKAKKNIRSKQGHRQPFTKVQIDKIIG